MSPIPIHRIARVGKYKITSYKQANEICVKCVVSGEEKVLFLRCYPEDKEEEFAKCFNDVLLMAKIKNTQDGDGSKSK